MKLTGLILINIITLLASTNINEENSKNLINQNEYHSFKASGKQINRREDKPTKTTNLNITPTKTKITKQVNSDEEEIDCPFPIFDTLKPIRSIPKISFYFPLNEEDLCDFEFSYEALAPPKALRSNSATAPPSNGFPTPTAMKRLLVKEVAPTPIFSQEIEMSDNAQKD